MTLDLDLGQVILKNRWASPDFRHLSRQWLYKTIAKSLLCNDKTEISPEVYSHVRANEDHGEKFHRVLTFCLSRLSVKTHEHPFITIPTLFCITCDNMLLLTELEVQTRKYLF